jgi:acyl-CoA synthetase (AMP-forming)/AMP-acid ligase II/acyl carrier protein
VIDQTLVALLARRARDQPAKLAYSFLGDGERETARLTFAELDRRARDIAARLQAEGCASSRVLLLYPPGLDYIAAFFGCLYAGAVAVPAYPPDPARLSRSLPRLDAINRDAACGAVLTTGPIRELAKALLDQAPGLRDLPWIASDQIAGGLDWRDPGITAAHVALLQYTSGSTGQPRGVVLSHANLLHNQQLIRQAFRTEADAPIVGWLPLYHDMGLIGTVLHPIYLGVPAYLMSPLAFLQRPLRWLQAITRFRGGYSGGPSFAFELCVRRISAAERRELDLGAWRMAFCGAEPVRAATLERFSTTFADCGFRREAFHPTYGLAESTLIVTGGHSHGRGPKVCRFSAAGLSRGDVVPDPAAGSRALVGCGSLLDGAELAIVDPDTREGVGPGRVGEIWVRGPSVAQGYFRRLDSNAHVFGARLAPDGDGPFLRTGDLGFVWEDELFFAGRLKDILVVRGKKHFPQDLEATVEHSRPELFRPGCAAAFAVEVHGEERIVVVQEVQRGSGDPGKLERAAAEAAQAVFNDHGIGVHAVVLIAAGDLPKTSSGKVQRHVARELYLAGQLPALVAAPGASTAFASAARDTAAARGARSEPAIAARIEQLRPLVARYAASVSVQPGRFDPERPLSAYGLDSMSTVELHADLEAALGVAVPIALLLSGPSLRELAIAVADAGADSRTDAAIDGAAEPAIAPGSMAGRLAWSWPSRVDAELRPQLLALLDRVLAVDDTVGFPGPLTAAEADRVIDALDRDLGQQRCQVLVAQLDGRVVGQCTLVPNGSPNNRHLGSIFRAMIDPDLRTANLLPAACGHIVERCRALGVEILCIDTRVGSRAARLWQALGFQDYGRLPDYARVGATRYDGLYLYQRVEDLARTIAAAS